ncbi:MAG: methyl-accepting chemotaxis protein [Leptospiraceae bacterium]|nr:methyl-accepting chemotaxis protein [Leptospiraceae bacterium]
MSAAYFWIASGILGGGVLAGFHACVHPGIDFVWLYSCSTLAGGFLFMFSWLPEYLSEKIGNRIPILILVASIVFSILSIGFKSSLPSMVKSGEFTPTARGLNIVGGVLYLLASIKLLLLYRNSKAFDEILFCFFSLFLGIAGILFEFSKLWDAGWWLWHFIRLLGYILALGYAIHVLNQLDTKTRDEEKKNKQNLISLKEIIDFLSGIIKEIELFSKQILFTSEKILNFSNNLSQGSSQQANSLTRINRTIEELSLQVKSNLNNSTGIHELAKKSEKSSSQGNSQMKELNRTMSHIIEGADEIKKIINFIGTISSQTNMLALNADIESSKVGQKGAGFAVVANEVRELSNKSKQSSKNITIAVENILEKIEHANDFLKHTSEHLQSITSGTQELGKIADDMSSIVERQSQSYQEIISGLKQIEEIVQLNSESAQEFSTESKNMNSQAFKLKDLLENGKLKLEEYKMNT